MNASTGDKTLNKRGALPRTKATVWKDNTGMVKDQCNVTHNDTIADAFEVREWDDVEGTNMIQFPFHKKQDCMNF